MTNKEMGAKQDSLKRALLVAELVANRYTKPFSPKVLELAYRFNGELNAIKNTLNGLARALDS